MFETEEAEAEIEHEGEELETESPKVVENIGERKLDVKGGQTETPNSEVKLCESSFSPFVFLVDHEKLQQALNAEIEKMKERITKLDKEHEKMQEEMDSKFAIQNDFNKAVEQALEDEKSRVKELDISIKELEDMIQEADTEIGNLKDAQGDIQSQINKLQDDYRLLRLQTEHLGRKQAIVNQVSTEAGDTYVRKLLEEFRRRSIAWIEQEQQHLRVTTDARGNVDPDSWNTLVDEHLADLAGMKVPESVFRKTKFGDGGLQEKGSFGAHRFSEPMKFYARIVCDTADEKPALEAIFKHIFGQNAGDIHVVEKECYKCPIHCPKG